MTADSQEAAGLLGLGYPALSPTAEIDSLVDPNEENKKARIRITRPLMSPQDWEILHDGKPVMDKIRPVDIVSVMQNPIVPVDPPRVRMSEWTWRWW